MISCLLSCAHQTHDRINVYHVIIISYSDHQTDPKGKDIPKILGILCELLCPITIEREY